MAVPKAPPFAPSLAASRVSLRNRVRKRSNHVTVILGSYGEQENMAEEVETATEETVTA